MTRPALIALLLATHAAAFLVGQWTARPSLSTAVAQLAVGDRPHLVAGVAGLVEAAGDQWRRWQLGWRQRQIEQLASDRDLAVDAQRHCVAQLGVTQRAMDLALAAHDAAVAGLEVERQRSAAEREALYAVDEDCAAWAAAPVCPGVLQLRDEQRARDRAAGDRAAAGAADGADRAAGGVPELREQWAAGAVPARAGAAAAAMRDRSGGVAP